MHYNLFLKPLKLFLIHKIWKCCRQEVLQLENEVVFNEAIIEEREQGIQEIQQQIGEVNEIFKDLAVLVHEQGVMIGKHCTFFNVIDYKYINTCKLFLLDLTVNLLTQMTLILILRAHTLRLYKLKVNLPKLLRVKSLTHLWYVSRFYFSVYPLNPKTVDQYY